MKRRVVTDIRANKSFAALTVGRLIFIPPLLFFIFQKEHLAAAAVLGAFLVADHYDGVFARASNVEGPTRRMLDSGTDRIAIWTVYAAMAALSYAVVPLVLALAARDLYCAWCCRQIMRERFVAVGADWPYRGLSALLAFWVMAAPELSATARTSSLCILTGCSLLLAVDLRLAVRRVQTLPNSVSSVVISATVLRQWRQIRWLTPNLSRPHERSVEQLITH
jgi:phosphatidylglycerophosphate synthase